MKQNPFSLYDFLGYFIPGAILIYAFVIRSTCKELNEITFQNILISLPNLKLEGMVFILIISYLCGHILSFLSSITVEKYSVWRYGFPSKYLLNFEIQKFKAHFKTYYGFIWGTFIIILILPTFILDFILGKGLGFKVFYYRALDPALIKVINYKVEKLYCILGFTDFKLSDKGNSDFYRLVQHYTYDNSKNHLSKFTNYVALYGFLRTMTLLFNVLFWYFIIHFIIIKEYTFVSLVTIFIVAMICYIFFMAFMKFYRRYTLEGFMVLVADKEVK